MRAEHNGATQRGVIAHTPDCRSQMRRYSVRDCSSICAAAYLPSQLGQPSATVPDEGTFWTKCCQLCSRACNRVPQFSPYQVELMSLRYIKRDAEQAQCSNYCGSLAHLLMVQNPLATTGSNLRTRTRNGVVSVGHVADQLLVG